MSDFSLLYKKYNAVSNLSENLNNSVITLKRLLLSSDLAIRKSSPNLQVSSEEVDKAKNSINEILTVLVNFLKHPDTRNELYELMDNPGFKNQILNNPEFKSQVASVLNKIKSDTELNKNDMESIDKFISVLDNEAGVLFRKLRTNRG